MSLPRFEKAVLDLFVIAGSLAFLPSLSVAESITSNLTDTEIVSMNLTGTGDLPLATDVGNTQPGSVEGYGLVTTDFTITESTSRVSSVQTTVVVTPIDAFNYNVAINASINLFADITLTDVDDSHNFAAGLGNSTTLFAPVIPLSIELTGSFQIDVIDFLNDISISDLFDPIATSSTAVYPLGVDVNGNGLNDVLKIEATDIDFILDEILLSDASIDDQAIAAFLEGEDVVINTSLSLGITGSSVTLNGVIIDETSDPPFTITLSGPTNTVALQAVPEPTSVTISVIGLAGLCGFAWRFRQRA